MPDNSERDQVRQAYADNPGAGHHVERLLNERRLAVDRDAPGDDVAAIDAQLASFGHTSRDAAASARRDAAASEKDKTAKRTPPAGRTRAPRQTA